MGFQLSRQMYITGQKLFPIISIVIMLFLPLSLNQSATVHATLESTLIGNNITSHLLFRLKINHGFDSANDEELINQEFDRVISDSPIRSKESDESASIFTTCAKLPVSSPTANGNDGGDDGNDGDGEDGNDNGDNGNDRGNDAREQANEIRERARN